MRLHHAIPILVAFVFTSCGGGDDFPLSGKWDLDIGATAELLEKDGAPADVVASLRKVDPFSTTWNAQTYVESTGGNSYDFSYKANKTGDNEWEIKSVRGPDEDTLIITIESDTVYKIQNKTRSDWLTEVMRKSE